MKFEQPSGFTLIELLVVMAILSILAALGLIVSIDFYRSYAFNAERDTVVAALEKARSQSLANINQKQHGVHFTADSSSLILFEGASYAAGDPKNQILPADSNIVKSGITDVFFEQLSGSFSAGPVTVHLTDGKRSTNITINSMGTIDW